MPKRPIKPREKFDPKKQLDRRLGNEVVYKKLPGRGWRVGPEGYEYVLKDMHGKVLKKGPAIRKDDHKKAKERPKR